MKSAAVVAGCLLTLLLAAAGGQQRSVLTVRVLVKEVRTLNGVEKTEWLPGTGYHVKVGDATDPNRYCKTMLQDPPGKVDCKLPAGIQVIVRIERPGVIQQCAEPFSTTQGNTISVTARLDREQRSLTCRLAPN